MSVFESLLLGLLQGLTEFLPVSSSGHLVLAQALLGVQKSGITFEVALHLATGLVVAAYYRRRLWRMIVSLRLLFSPCAWRGIPTVEEKNPQDSEHLLLVWYVVLGTVPAVFAGLFLKDFFEQFFYSPHLVCGFLIITGVLLLITRFARAGNRRLLWYSALLIGVAQAAAILPGISRSGATIAVGLYLGLRSEKAAEFSFLLALPAILGAGLLEATELFSGPARALDWLVLLPGFASALVSGYLAIVFLLKVLASGRFDRFAYYCWAVGLVGLGLL